MAWRHFKYRNPVRAASGSKYSPIAFAAAVLAFASLAQSQVQPRSEWMRTLLESRLDRIEKADAKSAGSGTRDLVNAAFAALLMGKEPQTAERLLNASLQAQDMEVSSKTYGQFKWMTIDDSVTDRNAVEFVVEGLAPLLLSHGKELSSEFVNKLQPHLAAALAAMRAHKVPVSYTNIFLMKTVNLLLLGQAINDDTAISDGRRMLDQWIDHTRRTGIHEFDSPTYYAVDLNSLVEGRRYASDANDRRKLEVILEYFWTDIAANFFPAGNKIGGPYSRDYAFLDGDGLLSTWLIDAGWIPADPKVPAGIDGVFLLDNARSGGYTPPPQSTYLAQSGRREVISTWDESAIGTRWNWQDQHISLGCTSGAYGPQDKLFATTFAGPADQTQISLVIDAYESPYGLRREKDRSGHSKPVHLPGNLVSVQKEGTALLTLEIAPSALPADAVGLSINLILPAEGTIAADRNTARLSEPTSIALAKTAVVTATLHGATFAVRLQLAGGDNPDAFSYSLISDADGLAHHAVRLALKPAIQQPTSKAGPLRVAFLVTAAEGEDVEAIAARLSHAQLTSTIANDVWEVAARVDSLSLGVKRSVGDRKLIQATINNQKTIAGCLLVNGDDLAGPIWEKLQSEGTKARGH